MKTLLTAVVATAALCFSNAAPAQTDGPRVQFALLLDTSSSMEGLITQAKSQLWKIVNEFITAKQDGKTPYVEVALYEYGNNGLDSQTLWIRKMQPLTRDLDKISQELFALKASQVSGANEYCGAVIEAAVNDLAWDPAAGTYKAIFIAGNESFAQGPVEAGGACRAAIAKGVIVNTIHCGTESEGLAGRWDVGAKLSDGSFMNIDQNKTVASIPAPQDSEIVKLNDSLNKTYLWYGNQAQIKRANQIAQDANAQTQAPAGAEVNRVTTKASASYNQADADLVDAIRDKTFRLAQIKEEVLPEEMKKMTPEERELYIAKKAQERAELQKKILELTQAREAYVAEKLKAEGQDTLDTAVTRAIREQAGKKQIQWERTPKQNPGPTPTPTPTAPPQAPSQQ